MLRHLAVAVLAALAIVAPARAALITYDVSISDGSYSAHASRYDNSTGLHSPDVELEPTILGLTLSGRFVVDSTQGTQVIPLPSFPFDGYGTFITSSVTSDPPTPNLLSTFAADAGRLIVYDTEGQGLFRLGAAYSTGTELYDDDANVIGSILDIFEHALEFSNVNAFAYLDGKGFPMLDDGLGIQLLSRHTRYEYDSSGYTISTWVTQGYGTVGDNATATESSTADVPEPAALALFSLGLLGVSLRRRRATT